MAVTSGMPAGAGLGAAEGDGVGVLPGSGLTLALGEGSGDALAPGSSPSFCAIRLPLATASGSARIQGHFRNGCFIGASPLVVIGVPRTDAARIATRERERPRREKRLRSPR